MTSITKTKYAIGIDLGGTKIEAAIISNHGEITNTIRIPTPNSIEILKEAIVQIAEDLSIKQKIIGIGFSIPGSINPITHTLRNAPNSPQINNTDFFHALKDKLCLPIAIENDANCLIIGESLFGAARETKNAVGLIMGTGFGSGVITNSQLITGQNGLATELGHTVINFKGLPCHCGKRGCVETYLSGPAIVKRFHRAGGDLDITQTQDVFKIRLKDEAAKKTIEETMQIFSIVIGNIVSSYDPEVIILGGGLSLQPLYYKQEEQIKKQLFGTKTPPKIKPAMFGDASGKVGAAALLFIK